MIERLVQIQQIQALNNQQGLASDDFIVEDSDIKIGDIDDIDDIDSVDGVEVGDGGTREGTEDSTEDKIDLYSSAY